jgi:SagB-type dehydrogenase family enzyme
MPERIPRLKRSDCLMFFFDNGKLHCRNYLAGIEVESGPILVSVLSKLDRWCAQHAIEELLPGYSRSSIRHVLRALEAHSLIVREGSVQARREEALKIWKNWGVEARFFHFASKHVRWIAPEDDFTRNGSPGKRSRQPSLIKRYNGTPKFAMKVYGSQLRSEFPQVLLARRTHRRLGAAPIPFEQISILLWLTWGVTGSVRWPGVGRLLLKTSPSAGARHPLEVYMYSLRIAGLPPGLYHYRADRHEIELLQRGISRERLEQFCAGQKWVGDCSALFIMTAVFPRTMWRYRISRAYRVILLEAGHFCQTFCLVATWLGLAPFCTAALSDSMLEEDLKIDGATESVLYAAGVGPKRSGGSGDLISDSRQE